MADSVPQAGDGYMKVGARLLGADNMNDPNVQQVAQELKSLNPGERKDGWLDLNEQVLTPDAITQARGSADQYPMVNQILDL